MLNQSLTISLELAELRKNRDMIIEDSSNVDTTINKFKEFWDFILMEHEAVLSNLDKSIPNFKSLFSKLDQDEKSRFKPILQIVAHSLQFLKKIMALDERYNFLETDYQKFVSTTNTSLNQFTDVDKNRAEMFEKQLNIMQEECVKLRKKEQESKKKLAEFEKIFAKNGNIEEVIFSVNCLGA